MMTISQAMESLNLSLPALKSALKDGDLIASIKVDYGIRYTSKTKSMNPENMYDYLVDIDDYCYIKPDDAKAIVNQENGAFVSSVFSHLQPNSGHPEGEAAIVNHVYSSVPLSGMHGLPESLNLVLDDLRFSEESIARYKNKLHLPKFTEQQLKTIKGALLKLARTNLNKAITEEYYGYWKEHNKSPNREQIKTRLKKNKENYPFIKDIKDKGISWETDKGLVKIQAEKSLQNFIASLNKQLPLLSPTLSKTNPA